MEKNRLKKLKNSAKNQKDLSIKNGLLKIYSNKDGTLADISHLDIKRQNGWRAVLISLAAAAIAISGLTWLGFVIFNNGGDFSQKSLKLEFFGPQNVSSGNELIYVLDYKNLEKAGLSGLEVIFRYPDGFEFISADPPPTNEFKTAWRLGDLAKNGGGKIQIKGRLIGQVGSIKTINATASFQPPNFSSVFKETASFSNQVTASILEIGLEGPAQILPEKKTSYKVTYQNNSGQDLENVKIIANYPPNFVFQQSTPPPESEALADGQKINNQWLIAKLEKGQKGEIEITGGYLALRQSPAANFIVQAGFYKKETNEFFLQQEKTVTTEVANSNLTLDLIINGSNQNQPINFGQTLTYSLVYKNLGDQDLDEVVLSLVFDSGVLDLASLEDKHGGQVAGNAITWSKDQISELDLVRPLAEGTIDFTVKVKEIGEVNVEKDNLQVKSQARASLAKIGEMAAADLKIVSNEILNNINTDVSLKVEGRYFDDDNIAVGSGPLPPVVGQKTSFRIYWSLSNSLHEITGVTVTTKLPAGVSWVNKYGVKAGEVAYSAKTNEIAWTINRVPPNKNFDDINVWFDLAVVPTKSQVKKLLILTDQTIFNALDKVTNSPISQTGKAVTSNLEDDQIAGGKGLVIDITE
ncbi:MAG: hypothetical protein A3H67_02040 [Candidatus Buchananbacteria bacterium RIFCSPLOWO2_02_FULL_46_11b]|uniref:DUF11 domain-containing protein n=1 Tax=Candidatus Buchananbacteria bacterium RIFCSPLOWO2_02_FULL_46_11b TaxID=1797548 RepID=A0A1G1YXJ7_9BACT|nr:MAG: hypothetical protein A3H67_02040 [Candidatus Buchananbacteria bacterium RIFCSPLOWO2_02_FULL_46_11b]